MVKGKLVIIYYSERIRALKIKRGAEIPRLHVFCNQLPHTCGLERGVYDLLHFGADAAMYAQHPESFILHHLNGVAIRVSNVDIRAAPTWMRDQLTLDGHVVGSEMIVRGSNIGRHHADEYRKGPHSIVPPWRVTHVEP